MRGLTEFISTIMSSFALAAFEALAVLAIVAGPAWAIPTTPDPIHTAAVTPRPNRLPRGFDPATDRHQHWNANQIDGAAGKFKTYAVWGDNVFTYTSPT